MPITCCALPRRLAHNRASLPPHCPTPRPPPAVGVCPFSPLPGLEAMSRSRSSPGLHRRRSSSGMKLISSFHAAVLRGIIRTGRLGTQHPPRVYLLSLRGSASTSLQPELYRLLTTSPSRFRVTIKYHPGEAHRSCLFPRSQHGALSCSPVKGTRKARIGKRIVRMRPWSAE